jgi:hypothetical protein
VEVGNCILAGVGVGVLGVTPEAGECEPGCWVWRRRGGGGGGEGVREGSEGVVMGMVKVEVGGSDGVPLGAFVAVVEEGGVVDVGSMRGDY